MDTPLPRNSRQVEKVAIPRGSVIDSQLVTFESNATTTKLDACTYGHILGGIKYFSFSELLNGGKKSPRQRKSPRGEPMQKRMLILKMSISSI